ncbi:hypothetical protein [Hansschlegelia sp.]|uniref:hypothetical protein n=1 Tax=Hansschlegelia sp. TaxID=2041892 RepID=UPI002CA6597D|nr:hypothetical protein [Hansschlegelia sp.]HVI28850.1 hypothetical protein [Hansschlegelia sp.]
MAVTKTKADEKPAENAGDAPANIPAASEFSTSGAPRQVTGFDPSHPAVDDNPRKNTTLLQNRVDFNDPTLSEHEAVARNMADQGSGDIAKAPDAGK